MVTCVNITYSCSSYYVNANCFVALAKPGKMVLKIFHNDEYGMLICSKPRSNLLQLISRPVKMYMGFIKSAIPGTHSFVYFGRLSTY